MNYYGVLWLPLDTMIHLWKFTSGCWCRKRFLGSSGMLLVNFDHLNSLWSTHYAIICICNPIVVQLVFRTFSFIANLATSIIWKVIYWHDNPDEHLLIISWQRDAH